MKTYRVIVEFTVKVSPGMAKVIDHTNAIYNDYPIDPKLTVLPLVNTMTKRTTNAQVLKSEVVEFVPTKRAT